MKKTNVLVKFMIEFIVLIINNRLEWHVLYKLLDGSFLPAIKEIHYCIMPSIFHLHIYIYFCNDYHWYFFLYLIF